MKIETNPNDLFIQRNVEACFKKDRDAIPHNLMKTKPGSVLKSLEYISDLSRKHSTGSDATKTNEPENERD